MVVDLGVEIDLLAAVEVAVGLLKPADLRVATGDTVRGNMGESDHHHHHTTMVYD